MLCHADSFRYNQTMKHASKFVPFLVLGFVLGFGVLWMRDRQSSDTLDLPSPFVKQEQAQPTPLNQYAITALANQTYTASGPLTIYKLAAVSPDFESFLFRFTTTGRKMTGVINVPTATSPSKGYPVIVLLRGYVPPEAYISGTGTKNAAATFARKGYVTIAPDFFGYGESDPELEDSWEARFIKPVNVIELLKTIEEHPSLQIDYSSLQIADTALSHVATNSALPIASLTDQASDSADMAPPASDYAPATENPVAGRSSQTIVLDANRLGIWAHSNGGQIALTSLEILGKPVPTTLWAPVTAPFPYSLLFFSDESEDEGKATRKWIAQFEKDYDVFEFSLTQHLARLQGELQLHHGTLDDAALKSWSDEFVLKVKAENKTRPTNQQIKIQYYTYPGADHNMQPGWNTAIQRDLEFFARKLK